MVTLHCSRCYYPSGEFRFGDPPLCIYCHYGIPRPGTWTSSTVNFSSATTDKVVDKVVYKVVYERPTPTIALTPKGEEPVNRERLFEYAIIFHGKPTKDESDRNVRVRSRLLKPITAILARDEAEVRLIAGRDIPEEYLDRVDQVEVVVVPFE